MIKNTAMNQNQPPIHFDIIVPKDLRQGKSKVVVVPISGVHCFNGRVYHNFFLMHLNFAKGNVSYLRWSDILKGFQSFKDGIEVDDDYECDGSIFCDPCQNLLSIRNFVDEFEMDHRETLMEFTMILFSLYESFTDDTESLLGELFRNGWEEN